MNGYLDQDPRHQRSFVFCFKYHTIVGDGRGPYAMAAVRQRPEIHNRSHPHLDVLLDSSPILLGARPVGLYPGNLENRRQSLYQFLIHLRPGE